MFSETAKDIPNIVAQPSRSIKEMASKIDSSDFQTTDERVKLR